MKYIILFICITLSVNVYANACSSKEQTILNTDFSNVKITYEIENDNKVNLLIYNVTENIYISYTNPETNLEEKIYYHNTKDGKYDIERNANDIENYSFKIHSNISSCYGKLLTTKNIIKPKINEYHNLEICKNNKVKNHSYCQKFITKEINKTENEVIKTLEDYIEVRVGKITTKKKEEETKIYTKKRLTYSIVGVLIIAVISILLLINKKRGEL